ncbi:MAG TPA: hypothetical protein VH559_07755 [Gemmatimonadaceae bacterium]|jgi:hypothetical protein
MSRGTQRSAIRVLFIVLGLLCLASPLAAQNERGDSSPIAVAAASIE